MKIGPLLICFSLASTLATAAPASPKVPKPLRAQIQRLTELLSDGHAVGYPDATLVQRIKRRTHDEIVLVIFTIEGFGGGNNHTQYFAVFTSETNEKGKEHFKLVDVMAIGGKGWRGVDKLNAKTMENLKTQEIAIVIDALEVSGDDAPNFPSKKITINLVQKAGRLFEQKSR